MVFFCSVSRSKLFRSLFRHPQNSYSRNPGEQGGAYKAPLFLFPMFHDLLEKSP